jgi:Helicase associated domain
MKLGHRVAAIRSTGKYISTNEQRRKLLEDMGFLWRLRTVTQDKASMKGITFQQILDAVETYKREVKPNDDTFTIPVTFVVPDSDPWPVTTRGLPLGKQLSTMKGKTFLTKNPDVATKLAQLGIELDPVSAVNDTRFQKVLDALTYYRNIHGDLLVPQPFVVPDNTSDWPEDTWGLRLGARVNAIRSQGTFINDNPLRRKLLDDIGFVWSPPLSERGRKRGRKSKEELESETFSTLDTSSLDRLPTNDTTESRMKSTFMGGVSSFVDTQVNSKIPTIESSVKWDFESTADKILDDKENVPTVDPDYVEPQNLDQALQAARDRAVEVGIILPMT